jgi:hypothetical protein
MDKNGFKVKKKEIIFSVGTNDFHRIENVVS